MTRDTLLKQLSSLTDEQFAKVSPFLEADLQAVDALDDLRQQIAQGRRSAVSEPLLPATKVYDQVRRKLKP